MKRRALLALMATAAVTSLVFACTDSSDAFVVHDYDPARDPSADLALAVQRATAERKNVLVIVGGDWCVWCHILQDYLDAHADVKSAFADAFVILKVNYSDANKNAGFLGAYPRSTGYPDFLVLNSAGAFQAQQNTGELEEGRGYNHERMLAFAQRWRSAS